MDHISARWRNLERKVQDIDSRMRKAESRADLVFQGVREVWVAGAGGRPFSGKRVRPSPGGATPWPHPDTDFPCSISFLTDAGESTITPTAVRNANGVWSLSVFPGSLALRYSSSASWRANQINARFVYSEESGEFHCEVEIMRAGPFGGPQFTIGGTRNAIGPIDTMPITFQQETVEGTEIYDGDGLDPGNFFIGFNGPFHWQDVLSAPRHATITGIRFGV